MVGDYKVREGIDPLPRHSTKQVLDEINESIQELERSLPNAESALQSILETQMVSLCLRVNYLLGR